VRDVFLTGGTGFVGGGVLSHLVARGRSVRAMARSPEGEEKVRAGGAEPVSGDVLDLDSLHRGIEGCRVVYHVAGVNAMCPVDPAPMYRTNIAGSVNVIRAAAAAGVERVIHTSSAVTIGEARGEVATEEIPHRGEYLSRYERSKHKAEIAIFHEAERLNVEVVSVNPSSVQGPGRVGGTARILIGYLAGTWRWAVDATMSLVFVDDCSEAHLLAEENGVPGERYLVSGSTLKVSEAAALLGTTVGMDRRVRFVPGWVARAGAGLVGTAFRLVRRSAPVCGDMARVMRHGPAYDGSRATRDLGLAYTPLEDWLTRTVAWYRDQGLV
jgi:dihydroflavonol-4-reductase